MLELRNKLSKAIDRVIINSALVKEELDHQLRKQGPLGSVDGRLGKPIWDQPAASPANTKGNICIFVLFADEVSLSTLAYIDAIRASGFTIAAINNSRTSQSLLDALSSRCWRIYDRKNIGRDFGAFKDGVLRLHSEGALDHCPALCIANDSMHFIPGRNGAAFTSSITDFLSSPDLALFSHISNQIERHYQSYFQVVKAPIHRSDSFMGFWERYKPLSHREHCIHNGEISLSRSVYNRIRRSRIMYTADRLLDQICLQQNPPFSVDYILGLMPSTTKTKQKRRSNFALDQLLRSAEKNEALSHVSRHYLTELFEAANPSHSGAFLFPLLLNCPLVKHDLCFAGSYSTAMATHLFRLALIQAGLREEEVEARTEEYRKTLLVKGIPANFLHKPKERALKGVNREYIYTIP